jgi:quinol monooxygenase YgiN
MIKVVAKNFIAKDKIEVCLDLVTELAQASRQDTGCISYEMYQDIKDETVLTMIETWENEAALQAHLNAPHFKRLVPQIGALAIKDTEMNIYQKVI